jgi:hypothetical protein
MAIESASGVPDSVDHVAAGFDSIERLGLNREGVVTASAGRDEDGNDQLLIVGGQTLVRVSEGAGEEPDEIHRTDMRSVELVPGSGLLLRFPGRRWLHAVRDADAAHLRETIIESPLLPPTGSNGQYIPPASWRDDQLARLVGFVVMRAAEAEHGLGLVAAYGEGTDAFDRKMFGVTGGSLSGRLTSLGAGSDAIADLAERYGAWSTLRNQLVHSIRPMTETGELGPTTHKPAMRMPDDAKPYVVAIQDLPELIDLWYAFNWLYHDALRAYLDLIAGVSAADLPMPNSVTSEENRLPQERATSGD